MRDLSCSRADMNAIPDYLLVLCCKTPCRNSDGVLMPQETSTSEHTCRSRSPRTESSAASHGRIAPDGLLTPSIPGGPGSLNRCAHSCLSWRSCMRPAAVQQVLMLLLSAGTLLIMLLMRTCKPAPLITVIHFPEGDLVTTAVQHAEDLGLARTWKALHVARRLHSALHVCQAQLQHAAAQGCAAK